MGSLLAVALKARKSVGVHAPPQTWLVRLLWLTLPVTLGELVSDALDGRSTPVVITAATMLWVGWAGGLLASLVSASWALVALRVVTPLAVLVGVVAAIAAPSTPSPVGWIGLVIAAVASVFSLSAEVGDGFINGGAYGDERRFPLRPPGVLLVGPIPLVWAAVALPLPLAALLLASQQWVLGVALGLCGTAAVWWGVRVLTRLTRRWCVFVPAGLTLVDDMALADPTLMRSGDITGIGPATVGTEALDLSAGAAGLILQIDLAVVGSFVPAAARNGVTEATGATAVLMAPTRPGALLAFADDRGLPVLNPAR